jgi:predicted DNA-binding transcriptional regulator AlpA
MVSKLLTFSDLRRLKGIDYSPDQLRRLVRAGKFPAPRRIPGSQRLFYVESEVDAWAERLPPVEPLRRGRKKSISKEGG